MKLSRSCRRLALFDSPAEVREGRPDYYHKSHFYEFDVGPFRYQLLITDRGDGRYGVAFILDSVVGDDRAVVSYLSRVRGKSVSLNEVRQLRETLRQGAHGITETGNSIEVFSTVLQIFRQFAGTREVRCLEFSAAESSRQRLYRGIVKRYFPGYQLREEPTEGGVHMTVCRPEEAG